MYSNENFFIFLLFIIIINLYDKFDWNDEQNYGQYEYEFGEVVDIISVEGLEYKGGQEIGDFFFIVY